MKMVSEIIGHESGFQPVNIFYRLVSKDGCGDVCGLEEVT